MEQTSDLRERDEQIRELRSQIDALTRRLEAADARGPRRTKRHLARWTSVVALLTIAALLLPLALTSVWADRLVTDTDRYVQTVAPLADDPAMQAAITDRVTAEILRYVDVEKLTVEALTALSTSGPLDPKVAARLEALAGPLEQGVNGFIRSRVADIVASPQFADAWDAANKAAHAELVAALTGKGDGSVKVEDGRVSIALGSFIAVVKQSLVSKGFTLASNIPAVDARIVLFESPELARVQRALNLLSGVAIVLPLLVLGLILAAVLIAPRRRTAALGAAVAVVTVSVLALLSLALLRVFYLDSIPAAVLPTDAAAAAYDVLLRFLAQGFKLIAFLGVVAIVATAIAGGSRLAVLVRDGWCGGLARLNGWCRQQGLKTQSFAEWTARNALLLRVLVAITAVGALVLWSYPTPKVALGLTSLALAGLAVIDFLRAPLDGERVAS